VPIEDRRKLTKVYEDRQKRAQAIITEMNRDIAGAKHDITEYKRMLRELSEQIDALNNYQREYASHSAAVRALEKTLASLPEEQPQLSDDRDFTGEIAHLEKRLQLGSELYHAVEK